MSKTQVLRVKNWEDFQHYKDRNPPWIKLYNDLLENYEFACLQDASKAHLIAIWLLASRTKNEIPADPEWLAKKINATEPIDLPALLSTGFLETYGDASDMLAECKQSARPEREGEGEKRETKRAKKLPSDWAPTDEHVQRARQVGLDLGREVAKFKAHAEANARKQVSWNGAFTQWLLNAEDYAKRDGRLKPNRDPNAGARITRADLAAMERAS